MRNNSILIIEIVWIVTGILCIAAAIRNVIISGNGSKIPIFALMALVCFVFALIRHRQRTKSQ
jgi:hypothetical protein